MASRFSLVLLMAALPIASATVAVSAPLDEAMRAGRDAASLPPADEDYFAGMDNASTSRPRR